MKIIITILFCFSLTVFGAAQTIKKTNRKADTAAAENYSKKVERFVKLNPKPARVFANVAEAEKTAENWQEFGGDKKLAIVRHEDKYNESALVWTKNGKLVAANFKFQSPSGDWAQTVIYYFREDGTLAKTEENLNTTYGNRQVIRAKFYGADGKLTGSKFKNFDLKTGRKIKDKNFLDEAAPVYLTVKNLPFYELFAKPATIK